MSTSLGAPSKEIEELCLKISNKINNIYDCKQLAVHLKVGAAIVERLNESIKDPNEIAFEVLRKWSLREDANGRTLYDALDTDPFSHLARCYKEELLHTGSPGGMQGRESVLGVAAVAAHSSLSSSVQDRDLAMGDQQAQRAAVPLCHDFVDRPHAHPQTATESPDVERVHEHSSLTGVEGLDAASARNYGDPAANTSHLTPPRIVYDNNPNGQDLKKCEAQLRHEVSELEDLAEIEWGKTGRPLAEELQHFRTTAEVQRLRQENEALKQRLKDLDKEMDSIFKRKEQLDERERHIEEREKILAEQEACSGLRERKLVEENEKQQQIIATLKEREANLAKQIVLLKELDQQRAAEFQEMKDEVSQLKMRDKQREGEITEVRTVMETSFQRLSLHSIHAQSVYPGTAVIHQESTDSRVYVDKSLPASSVVEEGSTTGETVSSLAIPVAHQMSAALPLSIGRTQQYWASMITGGTGLITICHYAKIIERNVVELITSPDVWPDAKQRFAEDMHTISLAKVFRQLDKIGDGNHRAVSMKKEIMLLPSTDGTVINGIKLAKELGDGVQLSLSNFQEDVMQKIDQLAKNERTKRLSAALSSCWALEQWHKDRTSQ